MQNLYEILGVGPNAKKDEIRKQYKRLCQKNHPDKGGNLEKFNAIRSAYETLQDDKKRKFYDETGSTDYVDIDLEAIKMIESVFITLLRDSKNFEKDLWPSVRSTIKARIQVLLNELQKLKEVNARYQYALENNKLIQDIEENLILSIGKNETEMNKIRSTMAVVNRAVEMIKQCKFTGEAKPDMTTLNPRPDFFTTGTSPFGNNPFNPNIPGV